MGKFYLRNSPGLSVVVTKHSFGDVPTAPKYVPPKVISEIIPSFLYLGSVEDATDEEILRANHISFVLCVAKELYDSYPQSTPEIRRKFIHMDDAADENVKALLRPCFDFIQEGIEASGRVLIHCNKGVSRAPTIIIAYLIQVLHYTFGKAWRLVRLRRSIVNPRLSFLLSLQELSGDLFGPNVDNNTLDSSPLEKPALKDEDSVPVKSDRDVPKSDISISKTFPESEDTSEEA